jgi:hypothetical protein
VIVGARISKSGNAMAQSGDLQGFAGEVEVGAANVEVMIAGAVGETTSPSRPQAPASAR